MITMESVLQLVHMMVYMFFDTFSTVKKGTVQIFEVSKGDLSKGDNVTKLSSFKA